MCVCVRECTCLLQLGILGQLYPRSPPKCNEHPKMQTSKETVNTTKDRTIYRILLYIHIVHIYKMKNIYFAEHHQVEHSLHQTLTD